MLFVMDVDDTVVEGYVKRFPFPEVRPLPRRKEILKTLILAGHRIVFASNQAGVAFGYVTEAAVQQKFADVALALDLPPATTFLVCYGHPNATIPAYRTGYDRRKPSPAMLKEAVDLFPDDAKSGVLMVGDREEDRLAAEAAGVAYRTAEDFFRATDAF